MTAAFQPPRCPRIECDMHSDPRPGFYVRCGFYTVKCRDKPVPRFRCKACGLGFSRQTFRHDYKDHKPHLNAPLLSLLISGVGLRQSARLLGIGSHAVQTKFRKLARTQRLLNENLMPELPAHRVFLLDEIETYEQRSICPLTVPVVVDKHSLAIVATGVAPIRRVARKGSRRQQWLERFEAKQGRRRDDSRSCLRAVLQHLRRLMGNRRGSLVTDQKQLYAKLLSQVFGNQLEHQTVSGRLARNTFNPLFAINLTEAMLRDNNGRLRRRSWLITKKGPQLAQQLALFTSYRNWHRGRTNLERDRTPGMELGLVDRSLTFDELLAWRQDWGQRSIHPASGSGMESISQRAA